MCHCINNIFRRRCRPFNANVFIANNTYRACEIDLPIDVVGMLCARVVKARAAAAAAASHDDDVRNALSLDNPPNHPEMLTI